MEPPPSVLLAEDDEGHATLVRRFLRRSGLGSDVIHLRDGQEVVDYFAHPTSRSVPDEGGIALILDLNMPRLNGFEVLQRMKEDSGLARIPVFVLTTTDNPAEIDRCYALGASACLIKPVDYGAFGQLLQRLADFLKAARLPSRAWIAGQGNV